MTASEVQRGSSTLDAAHPNTAQTSAYLPGRRLRPSAKVLPEHARNHNRALVLQTLYGAGAMSRADVSRETGLTRVTVSDLVAELITDGLIAERGQREGVRPGKPATLIDIDREAHQIIGLDLSDYSDFHGAVMNLDGEILERIDVALEGATGERAVEKVLALTERLLQASTRPVLGIGIASPGVVDLAGIVHSAPNLGWHDLELQRRVAEASGRSVIVSNDANAAVLAEHGFGHAESDLMLVRIGHGVGAGLLLGGIAIYGSRFAAGEIGHVTVGTDGGPLCACGKTACLEAWVAIPRLEAEIQAIRADAADEDAAAPRIDQLLHDAGERLGIALAPVVGALDLSQIVLSGPEELLDGALAQATVETLRNRTMAEFHGDLTLRLTTLGQDIVLRGAAVMVLSSQLGVS